MLFLLLTISPRTDKNINLMSQMKELQFGAGGKQLVPVPITK